MSDNHAAFAPGAGEEDLERMTPTHFDLAIAHMKLSETVARAARRCLVDGELQSDVADQLGMNRAQLSAAVRSIREKFDEILAKHDWECVEIVLPKQLAKGFQLTERYFVEPVLHARLARKKKK